MNLRVWFKIGVPSFVVCDILLLLECYTMLRSLPYFKTMLMLGQTTTVIVSKFLFVVLLYGPISLWIYWWMCLEFLCVFLTDLGRFWHCFSRSTSGVFHVECDLTRKPWGCFSKSLLPLLNTTTLCKNNSAYFSEKLLVSLLILIWNI